MSAEAVEKRSFGIAAAEEESAALIEQDVARGLENFPVRVWPLGAGPRPKPFQVEAGLGTMEAGPELFFFFLTWGRS